MILSSLRSGLENSSVALRIHVIQDRGFKAMTLNYYADTDSVYIDLAERTSVESREISEGVVLDYDAEGNLVGIDIDNASRKVDLKNLTLNKLPLTIQTNHD